MKTRKVKKQLEVKLLDPNCTKRKYVTLRGNTMREIRDEAIRRNLV